MTKGRNRNRVVIAIGSNLGDRRAAIRFAVDRLAGLLSSLVLSDIIETAPVGEGLQDQPLYLNAVVVGDTALGPRELLDGLLALENDFGRVRPAPAAARTLDLDLVLFGEEIIDAQGLRVPHPRFRERFFVLAPLAQLAPDLVDPVTRRSVRELLRALRGEEAGR